MRAVIAGFLLLTGSLIVGSITLAPTAWAGETIKGSGWELELPDGFHEAMSMEGGGRYNITSRLGTLPIESVPEMKAFIAGDVDIPRGVLVITKIALSKSVKTSDELGMKDLDAIRAQLPEGASIVATNVADYQAIEIGFRGDDANEEQSSRVLAIACGDYVVVIMLVTQDGAFPNSDAMWSTLKSSVEIDPPMNKVLLFGLIAFGAMGGLWLLSRVGTRQVHDIPDHSGRFHGDADSDGVTELENYTPMKTGVRPKVLPSSRPKFDDDGGTASQPSNPPSLPPRSAPNGTPRQPVGQEASPAATRPATSAPPAPSGLRPTRRTTGRWGD